MKISEALDKITSGISLTEQEAYSVMSQIMSGSLTEAQIAGYLVGLRAKGESVSEVVGSVRAMRSYAENIEISDGIVVDTCGSGGDGKHTFNISSLVALVLAAGGVKVAKHGNRSVSSHCGSADLFEQLGVKIDLPPQKVKECIENLNFGFLYAPIFHPAMRYATPIRRQLGIRTIFNFLGPLCNPANVKHQLLGVYCEQIMGLAAQVLKELGSVHVIIVHSRDGLDEVSTAAPTKVLQLKDGKITEYEIIPQDFGFYGELSKLQVHSPQENINIARSILCGEGGACYDAVLLNSALAFIVADRVKTIAEGIELADELLRSNKVMQLLQKIIDFTNKI